MQIQNIQSFTTKPYFCAAKHKTAASKNVSPVKDGITTAGAWFGFGVVLDLLSRKIHFSQSPMKNSLALNAVIGGCAGIVTGIAGLTPKQTRQEDK